MMHELFVVLSGNESSIFKLPPICSMNTAEEISTKSSSNHVEKEGQTPHISYSNEVISEPFSKYFHPCEKNIIKELMTIAILYRKIINFHQRITDNCTFDSEDGNYKPGHYITSLSTAVYNETNSYRKKIVQLEHQFLENPQLLLSVLLLEIRPFQCVFRQLCAIIDEVETNKLHGCNILDCLHRAVILAVGEAQIVLKRIRVNVQKVLAEQLNYWMWNGELLDPHNELFIKIQKTKTFGDSSSYQEGKTLPSNESIEARLSVDMLPDFIPLSTAEDILFIGESILCFSEEDENSFCLSKSIDEKAKKKRLYDKFEAISQLDSSSFSALQNFIEDERKSVAEGLYSLVMNSGFEENLESIKNILLLGRGELYQAFFGIVDCSQVNSFNINALFHKAGRQVMLDDNLLEKISVSLREQNISSNSVDICKNIHVEYKVNWPLHKLFDSTTLQKYNNIMRFLLSVQTVQFRLRQLWVNQKKNKEKKSNSFWVLCLTLRQHMSLLIYNIQYYLQVDVLDSQFSELQKTLQATRDYQEIRFHHDAFLSSVIAQSFISHPQVSKIISMILEKVNQFCSLLSASSEVQSSDLETQIKTLKAEFDGASTKFFWALNSLCQTKNSRYTGQLIMRIDYNKFYSKQMRPNCVYSNSDHKFTT